MHTPYVARCVAAFAILALATESPAEETHYDVLVTSSGTPS